MTHLKVGDAAPQFSGVTDTGDQVSLADFKGKKLVLFFYPKDDTPGCTAEACSLRDNFSELRKQGFSLLGVSADNAKKHTAFKEKYNLPFPLLADEDKTTLKAYGVWGPKKFMGKTYDGIHRTTFIIDEAGKIAEIFTKVNTKNHAEEILDLAM
ncbi:MAG: thioredoxin-dependent thiol peroxidase [Saprospiraceae bacterium]|nr:thioredoxin-dependent thiol peroxidase [Saprospiraceae bacterium]MBP7699910.1 thioredoxin-dependent thiol peroxidase [Saprospiraceae bacterium]